MAGEMAEILKTNQERYVPCSSSGEGKKNILTQIPFHGDQLFEERARNVQMTFQDGTTCYERLKGLSTEAADWHAKVNLYSVSVFTASTIPPQSPCIGGGQRAVWKLIKR